MESSTIINHQMNSMTYYFLVIIVFYLAYEIHLKPLLEIDLLNNHLVSLPRFNLLKETEYLIEDGKITNSIWIQMCVFFIFGYFYPGQYYYIVVASLVIEGLRLFLSKRANFVVNPIIQIIAYSLGNAFSRAHLRSKIT